MQRIAAHDLRCDWPACPYGHKISRGETYEWDVRLGKGWDRNYHLDCHRAAIHRPEPPERPFKVGHPFGDPHEGEEGD